MWLALFAGLLSAVSCGSLVELQSFSNGGCLGSPLIERLTLERCTYTSLLTTYLRIQKLEGPFLLAVLFGDSSCHTANTALFDGSLLLLLDACNTNNLATGKLLTSATQSSRTGAIRISLRDDVSAQSPIIVHLHQCTPPLNLNTTNVGIVAADFERAMCKLMQLAQACLWVLDLHSDANGVSIVASVDSVRVNMSVSAVLSLVEACLQPGGSLLGFGIQRLYIDAREIVIDDPPFFLDATFGMIDVQRSRDCRDICDCCGDWQSRGLRVGCHYRNWHACAL
jgi:hypothetical protein